MTMDNSRKGVKNKVKIDYGLADYYDHYLNEHYDDAVDDNINPYIITSQQYSKIVSEFNDMIRESILEDRYDFKLPYNMGMIAIRKFKPELKLDKEGKLINKLPVNARATRELWDSNPEAKEKKIFVRYMNKHSNGYTFVIHYYKKYKAKYKNKSVYKFTPVRRFKVDLAKRIKNNLIDAYLLW